MGKSVKVTIGKDHLISIYDILLLSNWLMLCLILFGIDNNTVYTNSWTKVLSSILCIVIHFVLKDAQKNRNPLLSILGFQIVFFYQIGVFSMGWTEKSYYLSDASATTGDLNYSLLYIIFACLVMWRAMHFSKNNNEYVPTKESAQKFKVICAILYFAILCSWLGHLPGLSHAQAIFLLIFNVHGILLISYVLFIRNYRILTRKSLILIVLASLLLIVIQTSGGSRSGFLQIFMLLLPALLVENRVGIKIKYFLLGMGLIPIMVFIYSYSSYLRMTESTFSDTKEKMEMISVVADNMGQEDLKVVISPVIGRMSYIDGACISIKERDGFSDFLNPIYCFKSIVDNVLTPGFDVFDTPRMSLCMRYYFNNQKNVKKSEAEEHEYQSDVYTIFGESYVMFGGWAGLIGIFVLCYYLKVLYIRARQKDDNAMMAILVYLFSIVINSYGMDWFLLDVVSVTFSYGIFKYFVRKRASL